MKVNINNKSELKLFLDKVGIFEVDLDRATNMKDMINLWRSTSIPYTIKGDPYSVRYANRILSLYKSLFGRNYSLDMELISNQQSKEDFSRGYPYISENLDSISSELYKTNKVLDDILFWQKSIEIPQTVICEFGSGWGNLFIPLARSGFSMIGVDIDSGFLNRLQDQAKAYNIDARYINSDFLGAAKQLKKEVDIAIFQASFHHCIDFQKLLVLLRTVTLSEDGFILFSSEPIYHNYPISWGLRYDGESLWAITKNGWLELGFDHSYFSELLVRKGFFLCESKSKHPDMVESSWLGVQSSSGIDFSLWSLPYEFENTFWQSTNDHPGRFLKKISRIPAMLEVDGSYVFTFKNFSTQVLYLSISADNETSVTVNPLKNTKVLVSAKKCHEVVFTMDDVYIPTNGDTRELGVLLHHISCR
jgi:2-polyprenyl-3-methyl-5-hydroxy-6-metoxy-1,4-benzoquinol methylase